MSLTRHGLDTITLQRRNVIYLRSLTRTDVWSLVEHYVSVVARLRIQIFQVFSRFDEPAGATMRGRRLQIFPLSTSGCLN